MYDLFFVIYDSDPLKTKIRSRFPLAKFCIVDEQSNMQEVIQSAQNRSLTKMFWLVNVNHEVKENFFFDYKVPEWDEKYVHVFKEEKTDSYTGVYLIPKTHRITKNETQFMFFLNTKEIPVIASTFYDYETFTVISYNDYLTARANSSTELFYVVYSDLNLSPRFKFDYTVDVFTKHLTHVFRNGNVYDGIFITSKKQKITEKEFNNRFIINRTEVDIEASLFENFEKIFCDSYDDYCEKIKTVQSPMVYVVTSDLEVDKDFKFDYQVPKWNQNKVHIFKNEDLFKGILLVPSNKNLTKDEYENKIFDVKIEIDIVASKTKLFDIVFISYSEPNADENYESLIRRFPRAKRIHGVKGIHQAHKEAAKIANTPMFWVVDGDAVIIEGFNFDYPVPEWDFDAVHVWKSKNPINDLEYGYGGVKLLPTNLTKNLDINAIDMTTSISSKFKSISEISNMSSFNTDKFNTWKSAFRECVKLSSKIISGQIDSETLERLEAWCTKGKDRKYGDIAVRGAIMGKEYGLAHRDNKDMLFKINDWNWLETEFKKIVSN